MTDLIEEIDRLLQLRYRYSSPSYIYPLFYTRDFILNEKVIYMTPDGITNKRYVPSLESVLIVLHNPNICEAFEDCYLHGYRRATYRDMIDWTSGCMSRYYLTYEDMLGLVNQSMLSFPSIEEMREYKRECYQGGESNFISCLHVCLLSRIDSRYPLDGRGMKRISEFTDISVVAV